MKYEIKTVLTDTIKTVDNDSIFIEPVCSFFEIDLLNQIERLKNDRICQSDIGKKSDYLLFGDNRQRSVLGKKGFIRWIQILSPAIIRSDLQDLFTEYQAAVFDFLYHGMELNTAQLEDIRNYAIKINEALNLRQQITAYMTEQNNHRNLCLSNSPRDWAEIKKTLVEEKALPEVPVQFKAIAAGLSNNIYELKSRKHNLQINMLRNQYTLDYQSQKKKKEPNPLPEGYRREVLKLKIKKQQEQIDEIEKKIVELIDKSK